MKDKDIKLGNYSPEFKPTPLSGTGDTPIDFYSWGDSSGIGLISHKQQMDEKLEEAFNSIEISEDPTTTETDYVLKVLGRDAGRLVIPIDSVISNAYYDNQSQELVFVINVGGDDKEIRISVKELIDDYKGDDTTISIDENNVISIKKEVMDMFTDLYKSISDETAARETEDETLQEAINAEAVAREAKDTELQEAINAEAVARGATDVTLQEAIDAEVAARETEDEALQGAINSEVATREAEDTKLQENIDTETTARGAADEALQTAINAEVAARETEDTNLQNAINKEIEDRGAADEALQNSIATALSDSKSYTDSEIAKEVTRAEEAENMLEESKADKEHTHQISEVETLQTVLDTKLTLDEVKAIIKEQIYKLFNTVVVDTADFYTADTTNPNESYTLVGDGETISMTQSKSFIGKSVKLANVNLSSEGSTKSVLNVVANDSELDNLTLSGSWSKNVGGNTMVTLNNAQNVTVSNVGIDRTGGYNAVEIGLDGKGTVKSVVIDGLEISSSLSNNGINIFSFEDNANIIIKNCHFAEVSNPIRISNMTYAKNVNITIQDCTFDSWESNTAAYAGVILLQDHTSASTEEFNEKNPFATFNITIDNVTGPYGKIGSGQTMEDVCASQIVDKQLVYMYVDKATPTLIPYTSDKYPTITIK